MGIEGVIMTNQCPCRMNVNYNVGFPLMGFF
jgi:hypothetical protein